MISEKILFAGGCHVVGHPVGPQYAFPQLAARELAGQGITCQIECVPHVPLHHPETVVQVCRSFRPEILVLQIGNFEVSRDLRGYVLSRLGRQRTKSSSSPPGDVRPVGRVRFLAEARIKQAIDCCLGHPLVEFVGLEEKLETFLAATAHCGPRHVIVTSTTPCADPTQLYYRRKLRPIAQAAAARHDCDYLDLLPLAPADIGAGLGCDGFFADPTHLGIAGQRAVARHVGEHLRKVVNRAAIPA